MSKCLNCNKPILDKFCSNCGQNTKTPRLKIKEVFISTFDLIINADKSIFQTTKNLTVRPGILIREYIQGKRIKYLNPFKFLFVYVALSTFLTLILSDFGAQAKVIEIPGAENSERSILINDYLNLISFTSVPIFAIFSSLLFRSYKYNYTEHLVLNSYIIGYQSLIGSVFSLIFLFVAPESYSGIYPVIFSIIFFIWSYMKFFNKQPIKSAVLLIFTFVLSYLLWITMLLYIAFLV